MITDFDLQTQSGQLWLDISERFADYESRLAALTAERDALKSSIAQFISADDVTKAAILADAAKSEKQKAIEAADAELAAAKAKRAALENA